ncbi:ribose-phosphate diphosphokinase [Methyloprofundus sp.]|uniref:ribose-phosphate diphosphokinase n=1 Tax=Methyloprofundus sp. TaxID=2020875 RepID=UPI003D1210A5
MSEPNDKLIELLLCVRTARQQGVKRITLVAPYLCYMRQDIANKPGEAVSQRIIGQMLAELFDDVITVDPHLHRISRLNQAIPIANAISLTATEEITQFLQQKFNHAVLLGPDSESEQWVAAIAKKLGFEYSVAEKVRLGDTQVKMALAEHDFLNKTVVIIDDMASTGRTLARASTLVRASGASEVYAVITHPLFCDDAEAHIMQSGIQAFWSTDSINHSSSCIHLERLLAQAIREIV